jgi:DtxR family Mn-dependent transcriptional regulator
MLLAYAWAFLAFSLAMFVLWDKFKKRFAHSGENFLFANALEIYQGDQLAGGASGTAIKGNGRVRSGYESLSSIKEGETVIVAELSQALRGPVRRRLLDLGIVPGTKIKAVISSIGGDPRAYEVRGTLLALRKDQTDHIYIKRI